MIIDDEIIQLNRKNLLHDSILITFKYKDDTHVNTILLGDFNLCNGVEYISIVDNVLTICTHYDVHCAYIEYTYNLES